MKTYLKAVAKTIAPAAGVFLVLDIFLLSRGGMRPHTPILHVRTADHCSFLAWALAPCLFGALLGSLAFLVAKSSGESRRAVARIISVSIIVALSGLAEVWIAIALADANMGFGFWIMTIYVAFSFVVATTFALIFAGGYGLETREAAKSVDS